MFLSNTAFILDVSPSFRFKLVLLLGLAYAASLGGVGTLIGTPPNVIFASVYEEFTQQEFGFLRFMQTSIPILILSLPLMALWLARGLKLTQPIKLPEVGAWRSEEVRTLAVFSLVALLWVFRKEPFGGWSGALGMDVVGDSTVALFGVLLMFLIPAAKGSKEKLLDWDTAVDIPWGMLLLFAGGICIAKAFVSSGLSQLIGDGLSGLTTLPIILLMLLILQAWHLMFI